MQPLARADRHPEQVFGPARVGAWGPLGLIGSVVFAVACGSGPEEPFIKSEERSTRAIISVERNLLIEDSVATASDGSLEVPTEPSEPRGTAHAMAHFVSLPQYDQPDLVLDSLGLHRVWPALDQCEENVGQVRNEAVDLDLRSLGHLELLDAGEVNVETSQAATTLAPRAFPTVSQLVSGVTYTTRDQSLEPLPANVRYRFRTAGSAALPALDLSASAPESLAHVTVSGLPIEELALISATAPLDVTWLPAQQPAAGDLVVIELSSDETNHTVQCAFKDDGGVGSVASELTRRLSGAGQLLIHRVRRVQEALPKVSSVVATAQVDFDFVVARSVDFRAQ